MAASQDHGLVMRPFSRSFAALCLIAAPLIKGAALAADSGYYQPLRIEQTVAPVFPLSETKLAFGMARIRIAVDSSGRLTDALPVAHTRHWFADSALSALKQWKFEPAVRDGVPVAATVDLAFNFERRGVFIVSETASESLVEAMRELDASYRTYELQELDAPPAPVRVFRPAPTEAMKSRAISRTVVVNYYIDERGRVRVPAVINEAPPELAALVVETVRQWQFQSPTHGGHPVLTRVSQTFHFRSNKAKAGT